jgi:hypothetical protein
MAVCWGWKLVEYLVALRALYWAAEKVAMLVVWKVALRARLKVV